ncbi:MAG: DUF882 domain-containing protein [Methylovulum sp.]|nr:DUF882 domain-containing protein [Methylovulum sp.]
MNELSLIALPSDEDCTAPSKRRFLKQMACGSLLAISGSSMASAAVRHIYQSNTHHKKEALHNSRASHPHKAAPAHGSHTSHPHKTATAHNSHSSHPHKTTTARNSHSSHPHKTVTAHNSHASDLHGTTDINKHLAGFTHKAIALHNINTGDKLNLTYFEQGRYVKGALQEINYLFRDYHIGAVHPVDPLLIDQLYDLKQHLDVNKPFHLISGYRSPFTNANMHNQRSGVAKHSLHMEGRAIDIRIEGLDTKTIRNAALAMRRGGVGYYPSANFVHLDTGEVRAW